MKKLWKICLLLTLAAVFLFCVSLLQDRLDLQSNLIRLHVVANSDSQKDQEVKLQVRDAVTAYLEPLLQNAANQVEAKSILQRELPALEKIANQVLLKAGSSDTAKATFRKETFDTRIYDTFTLPAGVYNSLRISIGTGEGRNWWCVVFPSLCLPATAEAVQDTAVAAGFDAELANTLTGEDGYELRFYLLDCLGKWENFLFQE